ncbi:MAG: cyclase family protein [Bacteroidetes bacterium]|nr:cyclase family protein [Bacteroidota bacterium]HET6245632.1 cyclase family protein [Bacteroidia bacterium]
MIINIYHKKEKYQADFTNPIDISIPLRAGASNVNAWYAEPVKIEAVETQHFIGDVNKGGSVNFRNIFFNPHANGTHTECVGHISKENISINKCLKKFHFIALLITITPQELANGDKVITAVQISDAIKDSKPEALIIRTLPNELAKNEKQYSNTNPPYLEAAAAQLIHNKNIEHLLIDLPSVDRESDEGKLAAHHIFWQYPENPQLNRTITELIYVPDTVKDGSYLLNLQIASFENDASPSKPVLYKLN